MTYRVRYTRTARRHISERLPVPVAVACVEFIGGPLAEEPRRVGKTVRPPLDGLHSARRGEFRVIYRIEDTDVVVLVVTVQHRREVYRS